MAVDKLKVAVGNTRGDETRSRILQAGLRVFGASGYASATTRRIAEAAGVALPAIKYYFENKEGLYLACAHEIVARYEEGVGAYLAGVEQALAAGMSAEVAREHLKRVMRGVTAITSGGDGDDEMTAFVLREMTEQGPAFGILYNDLWRPGVDLTARLVACIEGRGTAGPDAHVQALLLHASLTAFSATRPVSERYLAGAGGVSDGLDRALALVDAQIDRLASGPVQQLPG